MAGYSIGDTLLIRSPRIWDERWHLFMIISDPSRDSDSIMLLPCLESLRDWHKDRSCILRVGDHPFIRQDSVVNYRDAQELSETALDELVRNGSAKKKEPLGPEVLKRVIQGGLASPNLDPRQKAMLTNQESEDA